MRLALEALAEHGVVLQLSIQELDGDGAAVALVGGPEDGAHPAAADLRFEPVVRDNRRIFLLRCVSHYLLAVARPVGPTRIEHESWPSSTPARC